MTASTRQQRRMVELEARRTARRQPRDRRPGRGLPSSGVLLSVAAVVAGVAIVAAMLMVIGDRPVDQGRIIRPASMGVAVELLHGRSMGDPDSPVAIEVWADFQCPACGIFTESIERRLRTEYVGSGKASVTFHDLAFIGPESLDAAVAARVAEELGAGFWPFHDLVFANQAGENQGAFGRQRLAAMAVSLGMDHDTFLARLDDPALRAAVTAETALGTAAGIASTPTMVINGVVRPGVPDWSLLAAYIDELAVGR